MAPHLLILIILRLLLGPPLNVMVDRDHGLPEWYAPGLNAEALEALHAMQDGAWEDQVRLAIYSGYRSYADQVKTLNRAKLRGEGHPEYFLAEPGHSEHQLGTVFDVVWPGLRVEMTESRNLELYSWLESHAHLYGFVVSYPLKVIADWPYSNRWLPRLTEFIYEPWHIRYVGVELATRIYEAGYLDPSSPVLPEDFYQPWP